MTKKVLLLLGSFGSGKSTFGRDKIYHLWKKWKLGKLIPVFIPLVASRKGYKTLIKDTLKSMGLDSSEIKKLKSSQQFFFILDGYDER